MTSQWSHGFMYSAPRARNFLRGVALYNNNNYCYSLTVFGSAHVNCHIACVRGRVCVCMNEIATLLNLTLFFLFL